MCYKCCVLLSTYNGEKFIYEQLMSLYNQTIRDEIIVYIRDDGSKDRTNEIVRKFQKERPELKIVLNSKKNVGVQKSFIELMRTAPDVPYYAFCDQDDYWIADKVENGCKILSDVSIPAVYYSNYDVVDSSLNKIKMNNIVKRGVTDSITQILYQNRVPGCTMIFNKKLLDECNQIKINQIRMHDALVLGVAYLTGKVIGDTESKILYRQHESNTVGYRRKFPGVKKWVVSKIKLIKLGDGYLMEDTAEELIRLFKDRCTGGQIKELQQIADCKKGVSCRIRMAFSGRVASKTNWKSTVSVRFKILLHLM